MQNIAHTWQDELRALNKPILKNYFVTECHFDSLKGFGYRVAITKLRTSSHVLEGVSVWNAKAEKIHDIENHTKTTVIKPRK